MAVIGRDKFRFRVNCRTNKNGKLRENYGPQGVSRLRDTTASSAIAFAAALHRQGDANPGTQFHIRGIGLRRNLVGVIAITRAL